MIFSQNLRKNIEDLQSQVNNLLVQTNSLDQKVQALTLTRKYRREELAVELISKWSISLNRNISSSRKVVENLGLRECEAINKMQELTIEDKDNQLSKLLKVSLDKEIIVENGLIYLDEDCSGILRWHITTYLNLLESIMIAWQRGLAHPEIIEQEFMFLRSDDGQGFALSTFRRQLRAEAEKTHKNDPYPAITSFENKVWRDFQKYSQDREGYLKSLESKIEEKIKNSEQSQNEVIEKIIEQYLDSYRQKDIDKRFDIIRYLMSETARSSLSIATQKTIEILIGLI